MLEEYTEILAILTIIAGTAMSLAYIPQILKMYQRKSSADISATMYLLLFVGMVFWLLYGISLNNFPLMFANAIGLMGSGTVIFLCYRYNKN